MRITIIQGPYLPVPPLLGGATEKMMDTLGRHWARDGHRVTHICREYPGMPAFERRKGVEFVRIPSSDAPSNWVKYRIGEVRYIIRALRAINDADVVLSNNPLFPLFYRKNIKGVLYTLLGRVPKFQKYFYPRRSNIIANSKFIESRLRKNTFYCNHNVRTIAGPLSDKIEPLENTEVFRPRSKTVLYVGRIHREKGLSILIDAFCRSNMHDWSLKIVGPWAVEQGGSGEEFVATLRAKAKQSGRSIEFVGPIFDQDELRRVYLDASVFCYPSVAERGEALGLAPIEAMAMGAIPVVSGLECFQEFLNDGITGFVFDHRASDPAERLARALERACDPKNEHIRRDAVECARQFSAKVVADRYLSVFREVLEG